MNARRAGTVRVAPLAAILTVAVVASSAAAVFRGVSVKVSTERVTPGGMGQMKVYITEPKPISTGSGTFGFEAFESIDGIALVSPADDTHGIAVVRGTGVALTFVSPSGTFGTDPDYPVLTVAGRLAPDIPIGTRIPFTLDPAALQVLDPGGVAYPIEVKNGHMVAEPGPSIHDVVPGSAALPAGSVVTILGSGFDPATEIRLKETKIARTVFVDSGRIDVELGVPARMHGMMVKANNPDGSRCVYFSYQRTRRDGASAHPVLHDVVPVFPSGATTSAVLDVTVSTAGIALQNIGAAEAAVVLDLVSAGQDVLATRALKLPASRFAVRELFEVFDQAPAAGDSVRVRSDVPIQIMGVITSPTGAARPQLPR